MWIPAFAGLTEGIAGMTGFNSRITGRFPVAVEFFGGEGYFCDCAGLTGGEKVERVIIRIKVHTVSSFFVVILNVAGVQGRYSPGKLKGLSFQAAGQRKSAL